MKAVRTGFVLSHVAVFLVGAAVMWSARFVDERLAERGRAAAAARRASQRAARAPDDVQAQQAAESRRVRTGPFRLHGGNARLMKGENDPDNERWSDIAGNYYAEAFVRAFDYERPSQRGPRVWVRVEEVADTFRGRLEAHGLKPNFAYQIKLCGDPEDRVSFERIGYSGRWRLPGRATNYTDWDYRAYPDKQRVESYVVFDYFVTDEAGNAARDFAMEASLHVLWNASRQALPFYYCGLRDVTVVATNPLVYVRPKTSNTVERICGERESVRYTYNGRPVRLPPGDYRAFLKLTEESLHAVDRDGGWWATPLSLPVCFRIEPATTPPRREAAVAAAAAAATTTATDRLVPYVNERDEDDGFEDRDVDPYGDEAREGNGGEPW